MRIAVYGRQFNDSALPYARQVFDQLAANNTEVYVHQDLNKFLSEKDPSLITRF